MKNLLPLYVVALLCIICSPVLAQAPAITPFDGIYFTQGMTTTYQVEVDTHGDQVTYSLLGAPNTMTISNTGLITYHADIDDGFFLIPTVVVENQNQEQATQDFMAITRSALQINNVQIGHNSDDLRPLTNWGNSIAFHPGDDVYIRFQLENAYTLNNNPYLDQPIQPTLESVLFEVQELSGIEFLNTQQDIQIPLRAQASQEYNIKGKLPANVRTGSYQVIITAAGLDQEVPPNELVDSFAFSLMVFRNPHSLTITKDVPYEVNDGHLSCDETAQTAIPFTIANTGQADEIAVITLHNEFGSTLNSMHLPLHSGEEIETNIDAFLPRDNDNTLTVAVSRVQDQATILNQYSFSYTAQNECPSLSIASTTPIQEDFTLRVGSTQEFAVTIDNPSNLFYVVQWYVDNELVEHENNFDYVANQQGVHVIELDVIQEDAIVYRQLWTVTVTNLPTGFDSFPGAATTNPEQIQNAHSTPLTLENQFGKIVFDQNVDISTIEDISNVVSITNGKIAIDSATAPALNRPATITLYRTYTDPKILVQPGFNQGVLSTCNTCQIISNQANALTFHVPSFSTYVGVENSSAQVTVDDISINNIMPGKSGNTTITISNTGAVDITNAVASLQNVNAKYQARLIGQLPAIIHPGEQTTITVSLFVPSDESTSTHVIGSLKIVSDQVTANENINLDPSSYLEIYSIKVNSKTNGDLNLDSNKIEFKVKNNYPEDMDDVTVTVRILDVNDDDIEEEIDSFKLNSGDDKKVSVDFDLSTETLDEDRYTIEIEVEAEADDNTNHETSTDFSADVDRERHHIVFTRTDLSSPKLSCETQTSLHVTIENKGENDEDDVEIRVTNTNLNLNQFRRSIEIDDYSGPDQEYSAVFPIDATNKPAGSYPIKVELFRDGNLEETQTVNLEIASCAESSKTGSITVLGDSNRNDALKNQLDQALMQYQGSGSSQVSTSFRNTSIYTLFLAVLVFFVLIAVMLGIAVAIKRR